MGSFQNYGLPFELWYPTIAPHGSSVIMQSNSCRVEFLCNEVVYMPKFFLSFFLTMVI